MKNVQHTNKYDIFVSYAAVDNEPLQGTNKGWVTVLINGLKTLLAKKLGAVDAYSLWMDNTLLGNEPETFTTIEKLENVMGKNSYRLICTLQQFRFILLMFHQWQKGIR